MNHRKLFHVQKAATWVFSFLPALWIGCGSSDSQVPVKTGHEDSGSVGAGSGGPSFGGGTTGSSGGGVAGGSGGVAGSASSGGSPAAGGSSGPTGAAGGSGPMGQGAVDSGGAGSGGEGGSGGGQPTPVDAGGAATGDGGPCPAQPGVTLAVKVSLSVTWPATTAANGGSGTAGIWLLEKYAASGNRLTGTSQTCGLSLPDIQLSGLGQVAAGGAKVQIEIPPAVWAKGTMPTFAVTATQSGSAPSATFVVDPSVALIGIDLPATADPGTYAWPTSAWSLPQGTVFPDVDSDMNPAVTASPRNGNGYVFPPTAVGLGGSAPVADQVFIASRNQVALNGQWTSCSDMSGTAAVRLFDNHVVGCHVSGGKVCTTGAANTQADFLDQNRTIYVPGKATFIAKSLGGSASCSDALAALP